jgi:hypothetical protein
MLFHHGCFISYRRDQTIVQRFVKDLAQGLSFELAPLLDLGVFVDESAVAQQPFDESMAGAICRSVCMIVVFTPTYFSQTNLYCAREFRAMEDVERRRLKAIDSSERHKGLIIPVVLRGADQMPRELKQRNFLNFDRYMLGDNRIYRSPGFQKSLREIAEYIYDRYRLFEQHELNLDMECNDFRLPAEEEVRHWLTSMPAVSPPSPFSTRSGDK